MEKKSVVPKDEEKTNIDEKTEGEEKAKVNDYYLRISKKLRNIKYLMLLFMVAALIITLWAFRSRLTYDNFRYLFRDIDEAGRTSFSGDAVYFTANDTNVYLHFKGDLAVGSSDGLSFHRSFGSRSFEDSVKFKSPLLVGSEKYMIAYDAGGKNFYVYNSVGRVYSETLTYGVIDCAASDSGAFAVLTKSEVGDFVIRIYDKNFNLIGEVTRDGYVYSIDFFDSETVCFFESYASDATLCTDISFYKVGAADVEKTVSVPGFMLECRKTEKGFLTLSDADISFYNENNALDVSYSFGTSDIMFADAKDGGVCALLDKNEIGADCMVLACFENGNTYRVDTEIGAKGVALCGENVCVLYDNYLFVCNSEKTSRIEIPDGAKKLIARDKGSVIVCYNDYAKVFEVKF